MTASTQARAAFSWATCDPTYGVYFPVDIGANEADRDIFNASQYGLNEYQKQTRLLVNGNVNYVRFYYTSFNTELNYDYINLEDYFGENHYWGNLGTGYTTNHYPNASKQFLWSWKSDYSITKPSNPRFDAVRVYCKSTPQQTTSHSSIPVNKRSEAFLVATGDVIYTAVYQPANRRLILTADVLGSDDANPDVDLYASTHTTMPDDSNNDWRAYHGNYSGGLAGGGEALDLGTPVNDRWVYYGVRSYRGRMHVVLRPNLQRSPDGVRSITVCHPGVANISQHANWGIIRNTLRATSVRIFAATHGNIFIKTFNMKYDAGDGGDKFCNSIAGCDWCMTHPNVDPDYCGMQTETLPGRVRIPHASCGSGYGSYGDVVTLSRTLLHEGLHGFFGVPDEYNNNQGGGGPFCAHSVMNGPASNEHRLCLVPDHCRNAPGMPLPGFDCTSTGNQWYRLQTGSFATWFHQFPQQGANEPTAQIWATAFTNPWLKDQAEFTFQ